MPVKKLNMLFIIILGAFLVGCKTTNIDVFRFVNHEMTIQVGESHVLNLIYGEYKEDSTVLFSLSEDGIISLDENTATGLKAGEVTVTATIDGIKTTKIILHVVNEPISSMSITGPNQVQVGSSIQLSASVLPDHLSNEVTWSIEDSTQSKASAASISPTGLLTGIAGAQTKAEHTAGGAKIIVVATSNIDPIMSVKKIVYVKYVPTTSITLATVGNKTTIAVDATLQLVPTILPANACPIVTYTSSDNTVLTVNANGLIGVPTGSVKYETATITATSFENVVGTIDITVLDPNA